MLIHVAHHNLGRSFNGIVEDNVSRTADAKNDIGGLDAKNLVIDGRVFPAAIVNVGPTADAIHNRGRATPNPAYEHIGRSQNGKPSRIQGGNNVENIMVRRRR